MTFMVAIIPREVGYVFLDDSKTAQKVQQAFDDHMVFDVTLKGKHSKGTAVAYDPMDDKAWLLKPGFGNNSPALGVNDNNVSQSRREVAFPKVGRQFVSPDSYLETALLTFDGYEVSTMDLLPVSYTSIQGAKKNHQLSELFKPYYESGEVWKWSFLDFVLGNPDRHGGNVLVDTHTGRIVMIDHSSAFAGQNFNPGLDQDSFVPFYLRYNAPNNYQTLSPTERYKLVARPTQQDEDKFRHWLRSFSQVIFFDLVEKYGIPIEPIKLRFQMIMSAGDPIAKLNRLWTGLESTQGVLMKDEDPGNTAEAMRAWKDAAELHGPDHDATKQAETKYKSLQEGLNQMPAKTPSFDPEGEQDWWMYKSPGYQIALKLGYGMKEIQKRLEAGQLPDAVRDMFLQAGDPDVGAQILSKFPSEKNVKMFLDGCQSNPVEGAPEIERSRMTVAASAINHAKGTLPNETVDRIWKYCSKDPKRQHMCAKMIASTNSSMNKEGNYGSPETMQEVTDRFVHDSDKYGDLWHPSFGWMSNMAQNSRPDLVAKVMMHSGMDPTAAMNTLSVGTTFKLQLKRQMAIDYSEKLNNLANKYPNSWGRFAIECAGGLRPPEMKHWLDKATPAQRRQFFETPDVMWNIPTSTFTKMVNDDPSFAKNCYLRLYDLSPEDQKKAVNELYEGRSYHDTSTVLRHITDGSETSLRTMVNDISLSNTAKLLLDLANPSAKVGTMPSDIASVVNDKINNIFKLAKEHEGQQIQGAYNDAGKWVDTGREADYASEALDTMLQRGTFRVDDLKPETMVHWNEAKPAYVPSFDGIFYGENENNPHVATLMNTLFRNIVDTGDDYLGLTLRNHRQEFKHQQLLDLVTHENLKYAQSHPTFQATSKEGEAVRQIHALRHPPEVNFSVGSGKFRKLRHHLAFAESAGKMLHKDDLKKLGFDVGAMKLGPMLNNKGQLPHAALDKHIESLPKTKFNYTGGEWAGAQRHSSERSKVFKIMATEEHMNAINQAGLGHVFQKLNQWSSTGHPTQPGRGIGWVRYTTGNNGTHIDEIQTDFGPNMIAELKKMEDNPNLDERTSHIAQNARANGITSQNVQHINKILYGDHAHVPNRVFHEAFLQHLRDTGHVGKRVHIWHVKPKAAHNLNPTDPIPGHYMSTYKDQPEKMGYDKGQYGELDTQNNPEHKGSETWADTINKKEKILNEPKDLSKNAEADNARAILTLPGDKP